MLHLGGMQLRRGGSQSLQFVLRSGADSARENMSGHLAITRTTSILVIPCQQSGTIIRMALSSVTQKGNSTGEIRVNLVLNGAEQRTGVTKHAGYRSTYTTFDTVPIRVPAGSVINFVTKTGDSSSYSSVVALLIELDL